jgi:hypothetical protein
MKFFGLKRVAAGMILLAALLTAFSNCGQVLNSGHGGNSENSSASPAYRGGEGYDGITTYVVMSVDGPCADGSNIEKQIDAQMDGTTVRQAVLVRRQCAAIPAERLDPALITITDENTLIYDSETFVDSAPGAGPSQPIVTPSQTELACFGDGVTIVIAPDRAVATIYVDGQQSEDFATTYGNATAWTGSSPTGDTYQLALPNGTLFTNVNGINQIYPVLCNK